VKRRQTRLEDGRYLIFYTFEDEPRGDRERETAPQQPPVASPSKPAKGSGNV
jgi:hypothetical protein